MTVEHAQLSLAEGQEVLEEFFAESPLRERAVTWGVEPDGSGCKISMIGEPTDAHPAALAELPGAVLVQTGLSQKFQVTDALSDSSPFAGGMRYFMVDFVAPLPNSVVVGGRCTAGFPYVESGTLFILTAGHCWRKGEPYDEMWRGTGPNSSPTMAARIGNFNGRTTMGSGTTGTIQVGGGNHGDLALVNVSSEGKSVGDSIWTSNTAKRYVTSRQAPAGGDSICRSGTTTWQLCGLVITDTNITFNTDKGPVKQGDLAYNLESSTCSSPGESGGPVYKRIGDSNAVAIGIISANAAGPGGGCFLGFNGAEEAVQAWGGDVKLH